MIQTKGLTKRFGNFEALKGIDLNVGKGEIYGFLGHNGAGKSTTINILAGLSTADAGHCIVNGFDIGTIQHPGDLHIGYLPEEPMFYPWMTAKETLNYLGSGLKSTRLTHRVEEMINWVGLSKAANRRVGGFSRGMRQRLGMAAALLYDPDLLLLDEPSSALDPEGRSDVLNLISELKSRNKTIFLSTHILSDVERVCDRVGIISNGKMVLEKPLKTLLEENIKSAYDIVADKPFDIGQINKLNNIKGVIKVEVVNEKISVSVDSPDTTAKELLTFFASIDATIRSFSLKHSSLEDIFLEEVNKSEH